MEENNNLYRKFVQFDGTNWNSWKFRVSILLEEKNLNRYIEESGDDIIASTIDDDDEIKCIMEEKKCKSILVQCISDSHLEYVQDKRRRTKDMFDSLKAVFERKSIASQLFLRKKLITMKYDDTDDMAGHFLVFDKTVQELKSIGATLENLDIVCHLLLSMPPSYDNLVIALETLDPKKFYTSTLQKTTEERIRSAKQGAVLISNESGDIHGFLTNGKQERKIVLRNVMYAKNLSCNLMSIAKMEGDYFQKRGCSNFLEK